MNDYAQNETSSAYGLPVEPDSSSEILSATHIFTVQIESLSAASWTTTPDTLQQRRLNMKARLLEIFKGSMENRSDESFNLDVMQLRESPFLVTDYHGLWSHTDVAQGSRFLIFARAEASRSASRLMQEDTVLRMATADNASDVRLAIQAEESIRRESARQDATELDRSLAVLKFAVSHRSDGGDIFARYLWSRIEQSFLKSPDRLLPEVLSIVNAQDSALNMRSSLLNDLYSDSLSLEDNTELRRRVVTGLLPLLTQPEARPMLPKLVNIVLFNLIFRSPQPKSDEVLPDAAERRRLATILNGMDLEEAHNIARWLESQ
jgi:hypothetical protein